MYLYTNELAQKEILCFCGLIDWLIKDSLFSLQIILDRVYPILHQGLDQYNIF